MKKEAGTGIAVALFCASILANAGPMDTEVLVTISAPKDSVAAFRKYLEEPSRRTALEPCKETTNDAQNQKVNPDFPRHLKAKERKLFERLFFKCSSPGPELFSTFGAASREASAATAAPVDSIRVVFDTIAACDVPQCGSVAPAAGKAAVEAATVPCTLQLCLSGQVKRVNDWPACACRQ